MIVAAGGHQVIGLLKDGRCVANSIRWNTGYGYDGQSDVGGWRDIADIECCYNNTVGIKKDGTVVLANNSDFCKITSIRNWTNIEMLAVGNEGAIGLTKDGKIVTAGTVYRDGIDPKRGIVQLAISGSTAYALYMNGSVSGGTRSTNYRTIRPFEITERNVIAIKGLRHELLVLTEDGKIKRYTSSTFYNVKPPENIRLFDSYDGLIEERKQEKERKKREQEEAERKRAELAKLHEERRAAGVCQYCGGVFKKGLFSTKCTECGKKKDY